MPTLCRHSLSHPHVRPQLHSRFVARLAIASAALIAACASAATFRVRAADSIGPDAASGRLVVFLIADSSIKKDDGSGGALNPKAVPLDGPFWDSEEPIFAADVRALKRGDFFEINDSAEALNVKPSQLKPCSSPAAPTATGAAMPATFSPARPSASKSRPVTRTPTPSSTSSSTPPPPLRSAPTPTESSGSPPSPPPSPLTAAARS